MAHHHPHLLMDAGGGGAPPATTRRRAAERCPAHVRPASPQTRDPTTSLAGGSRPCGSLPGRMPSPPTTRPSRMASPGRTSAPLLSQLQAAACMFSKTSLSNARTRPACHKTRRRCKTSERMPGHLGGTTAPNHRRRHGPPEGAAPAGAAPRGLRWRHGRLMTRRGTLRWRQGRRKRCGRPGAAPRLPLRRRRLHRRRRGHLPPESPRQAAAERPPLAFLHRKMHVRLRLRASMVALAL